MIDTSAGSGGFLDYYEAKYALFHKMYDHFSRTMSQESRSL